MNEVEGNGFTAIVLHSIAFIDHFPLSGLFPLDHSHCWRRPKRWESRGNYDVNCDICTYL